MSRETLQNLLRNPFAIAIVLIVLLILFALVIWLLMRSRRGGGTSEEQMRAELVEMEREHQFAAATEQMPFARDAATVAQEAANLLRDYVSLPVLAIYAGREPDERLNNILPHEGDAGRQTSAFKAALPASLNANVLGNFWKPQQTKLGFFTGELSAGSFVTGPLVNQQAAEPATEAELATDQPAGAAAQASETASLDTVVFPWRAAYDWTGLILTQATPPPPP